MSNLSIHFTRVEVEDIAPSTDTEICARVYASVSPIEPGKNRMSLRKVIRRTLVRNGLQH